MRDNHSITGNSYLPIKMLLMVSVVVFSTEYFLMHLIKNLKIASGSAILLDSLLLIILIVPALYIFLYKPLQREIESNIAIRRNLEAEHEMLMTVLDSLDAIVYVADFKTYELIFLNKFARDIFGDVAGKTCWETLQVGQTSPCSFCSNNKLVSPEGEILGAYSWEFQNTVNGNWYDIRDRVIKWVDGRLVRLEIASDISDKKNAENEKEQLIIKLQAALDEVETLRGIIPICSYCKKIRDDKGLWNQLEAYISEHSEAKFSHGICPDCVKTHYSDYLKNDQ